MGEEIAAVGTGNTLHLFIYWQRRGPARILYILGEDFCFSIAVSLKEYVSEGLHFHVTKTEASPSLNSLWRRFISALCCWSYLIWRAPELSSIDKSIPCFLRCSFSLLHYDRYLAPAGVMEASLRNLGKVQAFQLTGKEDNICTSFFAVRMHCIINNNKQASNSKGCNWISLHSADIGKKPLSELRCVCI